MAVQGATPSRIMPATYSWPMAAGIQGLNNPRMKSQASAVMVSGLISQFTATVTRRARGWLPMLPMAEKSTASIMGKIIPQMSRAISRLIPETCRAAMVVAAAGISQPSSTPATIARAIHSER